MMSNRPFMRAVRLDLPDDYVKACASIVFPSPRKTRHARSWTAAERDAVAAGIARHPFFAGYGWAS